MNKLELDGSDRSNMSIDCHALKGRSFEIPVPKWNGPASKWEAELTIPGGDKSPISLYTWMRTKIEFEKLDYNYYQLSNYVFDPDYLRKLMNFLKSLIWVHK